MEQLILQAVSKHEWDKVVIGSSQHALKGKSSFTNLIAFANAITDLEEEIRATGVYLSFSKAAGTVSHSILVDKLMKNRLNKWTGR